MNKGIFISYRRAGNGAGFALSLFQGLQQAVGVENVFFDVSHGAIEVGKSWKDTIEDAIDKSQTLLVMVDDSFVAKISEAEDPVRIELETAFKSGIRVMPVFVGNTPPLNRELLPTSLSVLPDLQAGRIRLETSPADMQQVISDVTGSVVPEKNKPEAPNKISISRLPSTGRDVFGRVQEIELLDAAWNSPNTNVLSLVAWGGVGKSALVNHWVQKIGSTFAGAERVYAWSFYSQGSNRKAPSGDVFVDVALSWFGDPNPQQGSAWEKGERLAQLIRSTRTLLLLDGLEPLQNPPGPQEGRLRDSSIQALLRDLAVSNDGLCLISTRLPVTDLEEFEGSTVSKVELEKLSPDAGAQILRAMDVHGPDKELEKAAKEFDGHSLALTLLGSYIADVFDGDISKRHQVGPLETDVRHGGQARRVMESYEQWFGEGPEVELLNVLGLFDRPAAPAAINAIRKRPVIAGLTDNLDKLKQLQWRQLTARLRRARLLTSADPERPDYLDTHPLIREHFGQKLKEENPDAWLEANSRLFDYYSSIAKAKPESLEEMEPLFQAMMCACRAGRETDAFRDVYIKRIMRGDEYFAGYKLGTLTPLLAVLSQFFDDEDWTRPIGEDDFPDHQGLSIGDQLTVLTHVGWFLTATQSYAAPEVHEVFSFAETLCRDDNESFPVLRGLWVYNLVRAQLDAANERAEQILEIANEQGDSGYKVEAHLAMGLTAVYKGELEKGRQHLAKCLDLYNAEEHRLNAFMYGNDPGAAALAFNGFAHWLMGYPEKAVSECLAAIKLAEEVGHPFTISLTLYMIAMVFQARGDVSETQKYADTLIDFSTRQGSTHFLTHGRIFSAWAQFWSGSRDEAIEKMLKGFQEYLDTGAIVSHTYHIALLAESLSDLGEHQRALSLVNEGVDLIQEHADRRWEADLLRVKGDILSILSSDDSSFALEAYSKSIKIAKTQLAKSFELRSTVKLCEILLKEGKSKQAQKHLRTLYDWFSEGESTIDLRNAVALLEKLEYSNEMRITIES
ncbi:MAG: TIR domain-containing protein [Pseudomonadales bacterium]|nr:TIR domain-containing protein [Pseudomonadales bacterium]